MKCRRISPEVCYSERCSEASTFSYFIDECIVIIQFHTTQIETLHFKTHTTQIRTEEKYKEQSQLKNSNETNAICIRVTAKGHDIHKALVKSAIMIIVMPVRDLLYEVDESSSFNSWARLSPDYVHWNIYIAIVLSPIIATTNPNAISFFIMTSNEHNIFNVL